MLFGLIKPLKFLDALTKFLSRAPVASPLRSADWAAMPAQIREKAVWSAGVTQVKFVQTFRNLVADYLTKATETASDGSQQIKIGGRSEFVRRMQAFIEKEGIPREGKGVQDIGSSARLKLIFDVNRASAENYGWWKSGCDPAILLAYPGMQFVRIQRVKVPRLLHAANSGAVRRKDDMVFWLAMNAREIGGFGVPWGPWGYNSGMSTNEVSRKRMVARGLMDKKDLITMPDVAFNAEMKAEMAGVDPDLRKKLDNFLKKAQ